VTVVNTGGSYYRSPDPETYYPVFLTFFCSANEFQDALIWGKDATGSNIDGGTEYAHVFRHFSSVPPDKC